MARGTTLSSLLTKYRIACRISTIEAHNTQNRDAQIMALREKQEWFWNDFAWPHLRVFRTIDAQAGQRTYSLPSDIDITRIQKVEVRYGSRFVPVLPGIDAEHYSLHDSDLDQRAWPVQRWQIVENDMLELWPIPDQNADTTTLEGRLRITAIRQLGQFVDDADTADLDDQLLVKSAAADYLASTGAKDAQLKLDEANRYYTRLRGQLTPRRKFQMFTGGETSPRRPFISHYKPPGS